MRHPRYDTSATLHSLSEQPFDFTIHYNGHRESTYVMVNRSNTLPNTYLELAEYQSSSCRLLRHSKILAPVHSLNWNSTLPRVHCTIGTQSVKSLLDIIYSASYQKPDIACSGLHAKTASHRTYCLFSTWLTLSRPFRKGLSVMFVDIGTDLVII